MDEKPNGAGLLALGILSLFFGPLTAVPGLILAGRFKPFTPSALVGHCLCWIGLVVTVLVPLVVLMLRATSGSA